MHACMALRSFIYGILRKARQYIWIDTIRVGDPLRWSACIKAEELFRKIGILRNKRSVPFRSVE